MFLSRVDTAVKLCYFIYQGGRTMAQFVCLNCSLDEANGLYNQCGTKPEKASDGSKCQCGDSFFNLARMHDKGRVIYYTAMQMLASGATATAFYERFYGSGGLLIDRTPDLGDWPGALEEAEDLLKKWVKRALNNLRNKEAEKRK
jgi:hypothetical protein